MRLIWIFCLSGFLFGETAAAKNPSEAFFADLDQVQSASPSLKSERERLNALRTLLTSRKFQWTPSLSASIGKQTPLGATNLDLDQEIWRLDAQWNLWNSGSSWKAHRASEREWEAQKLQTLNESLQLEGQAARAIFRTLYYRDVLQSGKELVRLRAESHRIVLEKFKRGQIPRQEVSKSEVDQSQQETRLRSLEVEALEIRAQWTALFDKPPQTDSWPFAEDLRLAPLRETGSPLTRRLEKLAEAAQAQYSATWALHFPSLDLAASLIQSPWQSSQSPQWSASLLLTIPLWNRYETTAAAASAGADWTRAQGESDLQKRTERGQREILAEKIQLQKKNLTDARTNLEKSRKLYADMLKAFRHGRLSVNELLIEQNRLIDSEISLAQSRLAFHEALLEHCAITGLRLRDCLTQP